MPPVLHPWLLAGLGLVAVPILIHLIHRWRFRRVEWGAMDFLLDSQRKNRRRLWLQELLLMLLRVAAVALIVLAVARPQAIGGWAAWLGASTAREHVVLLDDSLSMGQKTPTGTALGNAKAALTKLLDDLARRFESPTVTIVRTTRPTQPEFSRVELNHTNRSAIDTFLQALVPSNRPDSPAAALEWAQGWVREEGRTIDVLHLIGDYQEKDWPDGGPIPDQLRALANAGTVINLMDVTTKAEENLLLESVDVVQGLPVAGVSLVLEATVRNVSGRPQQAVLTPHVGHRPLTSQTLSDIPAGGSAEGRFELYFAEPGTQDLSVALEQDALAIDNIRLLPIDVADSMPVLIVDGSAARRDSLFLSLALDPDDEAGTGIAPEVRDPDSLRPEDLSRYAAIYLLNIGRLPPSVAGELHKYVEEGGGLAIFAGDRVEPERFNAELGPGGADILPAPVGERVRVESAVDPSEGDLRPLEHPMFRFFTKERNSYLGTIAIPDRIELVEEQLAPGSRVIARHRDGAALILSRSVGRGRVVFIATTAGDAWTSWPQNPTYVVAMLHLNEYLAAPRLNRSTSTIGAPWNLSFAVSEFRPQVEIERPTGLQSGPMSRTVQADLAGSTATVKLDDAEVPGFYRVTRTRIDGRRETTTRAFNIDVADSDLNKISADRLEQQLQGIPHSLQSAGETTGDAGESRFELKDLLVAILVFVLVGEQFLGYTMSFHRP